MEQIKAGFKLDWKIEVARRSRATRLDLTGLVSEGDVDLTQLVKSLGQLTELRELVLADNYLYRLPESLGQFTNLHELDLSNNLLRELPESLGQLTQLRKLNLSENRLEALPDSLSQLTQLCELELSSNQLAVLPKSLGQLNQLTTLNLSDNQLSALPEWLFQLTQLNILVLAGNRLTVLPESLGELKALITLDLWDNSIQALPNTIGQLLSLETLRLPINQLTTIPESFNQLQSLIELDFGHLGAREVQERHRRKRSKTAGNPLGKVPDAVRGLRKLQRLALDQCGLTELPEWLAELTNLTSLFLRENQLKDLSPTLIKLDRLERLELEKNLLTPELAAASYEGLHAIKRYLLARGTAQVVLNEAKLILVGEGEVGKSCLLAALRGDPWEEGRPSTHGIEIKSVKMTDPATGAEITLNGWDFGGQRVYRPTHQLFFSAPAVYLVVWKPREGPQQGFVKEWIKLVKHREPEARIIVVATHGGPRERQPDIDRQEIWDQFGKETVTDFFYVQSRPPEVDANTGKRTGTGAGIGELRDAIAKVAAGLPEVGRAVPMHWQRAREALRNSKEAYLPLTRVFDVCRAHRIEEEDARLLVRICHRVGDLIHYEHDPVLKEIVVIKPDWLATAMSFVLDDAHTREVGRGLVSFVRLGQLWHDVARPKENRYPERLHHVFLRLMERFDLSYRVAEPGKTESNGTSLIAQLVPDVRPDPVPGWNAAPAAGDDEQLQICRIVDASNNQSAIAEGLFYQLIVRLHKYSMGRVDYAKSSHWQRGLVLEDDTGARAFLEHVGNDVRITVRSPYPERFLAALTYEVKWLVEGFWRGIRCEVTVPCLTKAPTGGSCNGLFEVGKLLENKKRGRPEQPCPICNEWHNVEALLHNAPTARPDPLAELLANFGEVKGTLETVLRQLGSQHVELIGRFDQVDAAARETISKVEAAYSRLMHTLLDEAKEGPRLFSLEPEEPGFFDRPKWISAKFKLTLWCEHSRVPLWQVADDPTMGVYRLDLPREWLVRAAPILKMFSSTLSLILPVVAALPKVTLAEVDYKNIESQLALGKSAAESLLKGGGQVGEWLAQDDDLDIPLTSSIRAEGAVLRQLHVWLKEKDPSFAGMTRVQNRRQEFLWVHPRFAQEY